MLTRSSNITFKTHSIRPTSVERHFAPRGLDTMQIQTVDSVQEGELYVISTIIQSMNMREDGSQN